MKKPIVHKIQQLAQVLPVDFEIIPEEYTFTSEEMLLTTPIEPGKVAVFTWYRQVLINHEERLKEVYKRKGVPGIFEYAQKYAAK